MSIQKIDKRRRHIIIDGMKHCTGKGSCGLLKPLEEFSVRKRNKKKYNSHNALCKRCCVKKSYEWKKLNRERINSWRRERYAKHKKKYALTALRSNLKTKYKLTINGRDQILNAQGNACWLNSESCKGRLCVDHCHITGVVRGILCSIHNTAIGKLGDNLEGVNRAALYLEMTKHGFVPPPPKENDSRTHEDMIQNAKENPPSESWHEEEFVR